jgi:hypothetical protein
MKVRRMMVMAVLVASTLTFGGEAFARGGGAGAQGGKGQGTMAMSRSTNQVRPMDSQRRDGTFQTTGTTANGSTTRPDKGQGLMDGTGPNHPVRTETPSTTP